MEGSNITILAERLPFWEHLSSAEKDLLVQSAVSVHYDKNTAVHTADFECIGILLVKSGTLRVYMLSEDGKEVTLYRISSGDVCVLSAACVLQAITFDVCIDALTDCDMIQISSAAFSQVMKENIHAEAFTYKLATERFSDVMWAMQQILFMSFDRRLATFLLDETAARGSDTLKMTHEEIARMMGSAREVVTRMLKYFSQEGWVELSRGTVKLLDRKKLMALL
ncbi:Crp/Fnr family transcriptional regulator [Anaerovorax odorimutans]|uniref:Crp/Fnr family transcriptional regulator n=1 Tax=Anaerovorax odorimutans TaxID=109327 RepID=A0ABT1RS37_9FIRM|nr:Crp/Fnr family transcriptional regulator [Anaerovorax odorimutans]MCQ4637959.1 Crp/Fnr family transcriptional regulator [Anaerovorax odorimutans]